MSDEQINLTKNEPFFSVRFGLYERLLWAWVYKAILIRLDALTLIIRLFWGL